MRKKNIKAEETLLDKLQSGQTLKPVTREDEKSLETLLFDMMKSAGGSEGDIRDAMNILNRK